MNTITALSHPIAGDHSTSRLRFRTLVAVLVVGLFATVSAVAQRGGSALPSDTIRHAGIIWLNSIYGPNNSGVGVAARWWFLGIGTTIFGFAGDTATSLPPRPGGMGFTIDFYLAIDFSKWLAAYGNIGLVGRLSTYPEQEHLEKNYEKQEVISVGGGFQVTLVSRIVLGVGYNAMVATDEADGPTYKTIRSIVGQLGWRF